MFHNYFFLKRLADALDKQLTGLLLLECFSQNKDELILGFANEEKEFIIRANLEPNVSLLQFPEEFSRAGKNSINLFKDLIDQVVTSVEAFDYERSFVIRFINGDSLIFKMHARGANILHVHDNKVINLFRKNLSQDSSMDPNLLHKKIELTEEQFQLYNTDPLEFIPALGKETKVYLERKGFYELDESKKWKAFQNLLKELDDNPIYLVESPLRISLLHIDQNDTLDPIAAANWLYEKTVRSFYFDKEKQQVINQLKQKIRKSESYITKNKEKLTQIEDSRSPEEIANILMANLHQIQTGLSKIVLTDIYTNEPITIKLNTSLSPQKNAENYYRKSKNRHQEIDALKENIQSKEKLIDSLSRQILELDEIDTHKELRKFKKAHGFEKEKKVRDIQLPYHEFEQDGWLIWVGKNSKANDELTLKYAKKNDLWLHAKDVPGSHVVIKEKPGQNYPEYIIEKAAGLAAANSKRKTDTLCPVIYTPKKFVRKMKGAPAGQVIVEKEEVVIVEPSSP